MLTWIDSTAELVGALAVIVGSGWAGGRFVWTRVGAPLFWHPVLHTYRNLQAAADDSAWIRSKMYPKVEAIFQELTPNGGHSLADSVRRMERRIEHLDSSFRTLLNNGTAGFVFTDAEGQVLWVNRTLARWAGRDTTEFLGAGWENTILEEDREMVTERWEDAVEKEIDLTIDYRIRSTDGETIGLTANVARQVVNGETSGWIAEVHRQDDRRRR